MKKILIFLLCIFLQTSPARAEKNDTTNLIKLLGDSDHRTIAQASQKFKKSGSSTVPDLIQVLKDDKADINLRINSILTLERIGQDAKKAVPALIETIEDDNFLIRKATAYSLGSIDPNNKRVISALIRALHDSNEGVSTNALLSLQKCGSEASPELAGLLKSDDLDIKTKASIILHNHFQYQNQVIPVLIRALSLDNDMLRSFSAISLAEIGPSVIPELSKALIKDDKTTPIGIAFTLSQMSTEDKSIHSAIPILIRLLHVDDKEVIIQSAEILSKMGPEAKLATTALTEILSNDDNEIRAAAMVALSEIGPGAIPDLIAVMDDGNYNKRFCSILMLNEFEHLPDSTIQPLINALNDTNPIIRINAIRSLGNVCNPNDEVVTTLTEAADDKNKQVSAIAKETIKKIKARKISPVPCD
jgi:HEAT repeat protein